MMTNQVDVAASPRPHLASAEGLVKEMPSFEISSFVSFFFILERGGKQG